MATPHTPDMLLRGLSRDRLLAVIRRAGGRPAARLGAWQSERLFGTGGGTHSSATFRLSGVLTDAGSARDWSLILKLFFSNDGAPRATHDWQRELNAYASGWLAGLPGGLHAPRTFGAEQLTDGVYALWLEDVGASSDWSPARAAQAARVLGAFNGAYLTGTPWPQGDWLSRDWLRQETGRVAPALARLAAPAEPLAARLFTRARRRALRRLHADRATLLDALDQLPQTLTHGDAYSRNLLWRGETLFAVDWMFAGVAPLGSELAALVWVTLAYADVDADEAEAFDAVVFRAYLDGLSEYGWRGHPDQPRLGFTAAVSFRYLSTMLYLFDMLSNPDAQATFLPSVTRTLPEMVRQWTLAGDYVDRRIVEAYRLTARRTLT